MASICDCRNHTLALLSNKVSNSWGKCLFLIATIGEEKQISGVIQAKFRINLAFCDGIVQVSAFQMKYLECVWIPASHPSSSNGP